ncbi:MAG: type VI secretion system protein TssA [Pseudomonadota bacterium]
MQFDPDDLLIGFGDDEPAGPDLEYDPEFSEMVIAATPKAEAQVGDTIREGEEADFSEVLKLGRGLLDRTMDIRVAVYMAEAALPKHGFPLFAQLLRYIHGTLLIHWDHVHPQPDEDDGDLTERMNALRGLTGDETTLRQLRRAPISDSRGLGRFSLRHLAVAKGEMARPSDMDNPPDATTISAAMRDTPPEAMAAIREGIELAFTAVNDIDELCTEKAGSDAPDLSPLRDLLKSARGAIAETLGGVGDDDDDASPEEGDDDMSGPMAGGGASGVGVGAINNPKDVTRAIDAIIDYYKRAEPSSPVPLLLSRARRLVSADFLTIMKDMANSGIEEARTMSGLPPEEEEY